MENCLKNAEVLSHWNFDDNKTYIVRIIPEVPNEEIGLLTIEDFELLDIEVTEWFDLYDILPFSFSLIYQKVFDNFIYYEGGAIIIDTGKKFNKINMFVQNALIAVEIDSYQQGALVVGFNQNTKKSYDIENLRFYYAYARKNFYDKICPGFSLQQKLNLIKHKLRRKLFVQLLHINLYLKLPAIKPLIYFILTMCMNVTKIEFTQLDLVLNNLYPTNLIKEFLYVKPIDKNEAGIIGDMIGIDPELLFQQYDVKTNYIDLIRNGNRLINQWKNDVNKLWNLVLDDIYKVREFPLSYIDYVSNFFYKSIGAQNQYLAKEKLIMTLLANDLDEAIINVFFIDVEHNTYYLEKVIDKFKPPIEIYRKLGLKNDAVYVGLTHIRGRTYILGTKTLELDFK